MPVHQIHKIKLEQIGKVTSDNTSKLDEYSRSLTGKGI